MSPINQIQLLKIYIGRWLKFNSPFLLIRTELSCLPSWSHTSAWLCSSSCCQLCKAVSDTALSLNDRTQNKLHGKICHEKTLPCRRSFSSQHKRLCFAALLHERVRWARRVQQIFLTRSPSSATWGWLETSQVFPEKVSNSGRIHLKYTFCLDN